MITIRGGRQRSSKRKATETEKSAEGKVKTYLAPVGGLMTAVPRTIGDGAVVLENFWPTTTGIEPRGGLALIGIAPAPIVSLFAHRASGQKFAATATAIYPFTDTTLGAASVTGLTGGSWVTFEVQNAGGSFLVCVNGQDAARTFNGTTWAASTITGVSTSALSYVWGNRNRLFFVQKGTLSAWFLGTNSIGGAATELPLSATFRKGGALIAGATWSSDSGDGMDDRCVFITDAGEAAVFSGSNPADVANWQLEGVYDVGPIMGPRSIASLAGDVIFATRRGIIPLSGAVSKDPAELSSVSLVARISPNWESAVVGIPEARLTVWEEGAMMIAAPLGAGVAFAANMETNAWCSITGWPAAEIKALNGGLYVAGMSGRLFRGWVGGSDNGARITCRAMFQHDVLDAPANLKTAHMVRPVWRYYSDFSQAVSIGADFSETFPGVPVSSAASTGSAGTGWDVSAWDVSAWGGDADAYQTKADWITVHGTGQSLGVQVQVAVNSTARLAAQLQRVDFLYGVGGTDF